MLYNKGTWKDYITELDKGTKIGILVDMFRGDLKYFINGVDKGYALQNKNILTKTTLFVTVSINADKRNGTIRFVP